MIRRWSETRAVTGVASWGNGHWVRQRGSNDSFVSAIYWNLCAGRLGEKRSAHLNRHLGNVTTGHVYLEDVVPLVFFNCYSVSHRPRPQHFVRPNPCVENHV